MSLREWLLILVIHKQKIILDRPLACISPGRTPFAYWYCMMYGAMHTHLPLKDCMLVAAMPLSLSASVFVHIDHGPSKCRLWVLAEQVIRSDAPSNAHQSALTTTPADGHLCSARRSDRRRAADRGRFTRARPAAGVATARASVDRDPLIPRLYEPPRLKSGHKRALSLN